MNIKNIGVVENMSGFLCLHCGKEIDVFDIGKNGILLILAFSSILMIGVGVYLSKKFKK